MFESAFLGVMTNAIFSVLIIISMLVSKIKSHNEKEGGIIMDVMTVSFTVPHALVKLVDDGKLTKAELLLIIANCSEVKIEGAQECVK